ncbi:HAD family hydrolase [Paraburkholderia fungorum]|uniref:HAD family hydrolase n=1 Tax=Paraburkholderia fungorum TaxID=134537 RepID=UPI00402B0A70
MVIFDFDLTMVNTRPVEALRANRNWSAVMARVSDLEVYDGINDLLTELRLRKQVIAIVTKSPDMVPKAFARHHNWPIDIVIGYHQVQRRKPDPEGLLLAMAKGKGTPSSTFHVGDDADDTAASRAAGVTAIGAGWGLADVSALSASKPDHLFKSVAELRQLLLAGH